MRLLHYSAKPFVFDPTKTYTDEERRDKPTGLWVSVEGEDDWAAWCKGESYDLEGLQHSAEVILASHANVLYLETEGAMYDFWYQYRCNRDERELRAIHWPHVKRDYDGIIITPYQWRCCLALLWYHTWDCASGCIWNLAAIEAVISLC